jgi:hypothetical protein
VFGYSEERSEEEEECIWVERGALVAIVRWHNDRCHDRTRLGLFECKDNRRRKDCKRSELRLCRQ